jgi:hypothetical protein
MKYTIFLSALLICICTVPGCKKDDPDCPPDLPCATQTGENTFGCYIDGEPWVAKVEPYVLDPSAHKIEASYDETDYGTFNDNYFRLLGAYRGDTSSSLIIHFKPLLQTGRAFINTLNFYGIEFRTSQNLFKIDPDSPYEIHFTKLDTVKNIASGTFYFSCISDSDTLSVTDGRFDVRYSPE